MKTYLFIQDRGCDRFSAAPSPFDIVLGWGLNGEVFAEICKKIEITHSQSLSRLAYKLQLTSVGSSRSRKRSMDQDNGWKSLDLACLPSCQPGGRDPGIPDSQDGQWVTQSDSHFDES